MSASADLRSALASGRRCRSNSFAGYTMTARTALKALFTAILLTMLLCTSYASVHQPVWAWGGLTRGADRYWTMATLLDAYFGFMTFYVWVHYKERRGVVRLLWFIAVMLLGNMAMSAYVLKELARLKPEDSLSQLLVARNP